MADVGCRNTVFGAEAQQPAQYLREWLNAGIGHYRVEFAHETGEQVCQIGEVCRKAIIGDLDPSRFAAELRAVSPAGVTEGSLIVPELRILN